MINYVYCSTNPDQKELAKGFCGYDFVNPVPIYDQYSTKDYAKETLKGLYGKTIVQWFAGISDTIEEFNFDWWIDEHFISTYSKKPSQTRKYYVTSEYCLEKLKEKHNIHSRYLLRCGQPMPIIKNFLNYKNLRIGVYGGIMKNVDLKKIYDSLEKSDLSEFELYTQGQGEYRLHENTKTDSEIYEECPNIKICDFSPIDMDVCICTHAMNETHVNACLRAGVPIITHPNSYGSSLQRKYNSLVVAKGENWGRYIKTALSPAVKTGRQQMSYLMNEENYRNIWHIRRVSKEIPKSISKVNVFALFRNNEDTIGATLSGLKTATRRIKCDANYYIYENDSNDDTPNLIKEFYTHSKGAYACEILGNKEHAGNSRPERLRDLAIYRNKMKELCKNWNDAEYSFIVDSEIKFSHDIMKKMLTTICSDEQIAMVTPFGTPEYSDAYYDTFALLDRNGTKESPQNYTITEVKSAFSGFVCIKTEILKYCQWDSVGDKSEHIHFCDMVRQYGKIVVDPSIKVIWKK